MLATGAVRENPEYVSIIAKIMGFGKRNRWVFGLILGAWGFGYFGLIFDSFSCKSSVSGVKWDIIGVILTCLRALRVFIPLMVIAGY